MQFQLCHVLLKRLWCAFVSLTVKTGSHCCQGWDIIAAHELLLASPVTLVRLPLLNHGPKWPHVQFIYLNNQVTTTLLIQSWLTGLLIHTHTVFLLVYVWKCTHELVPRAASRGLYVTTNPCGSSAWCLWPLSGCKAETPVRDGLLSVNGGSHHGDYRMFSCVQSASLIHLLSPVKPCFPDNQVQESRPKTGTFFHAVFFYWCALPFWIVRMLNEHFFLRIRNLWVGEHRKLWRTG